MKFWNKFEGDKPYDRMKAAVDTDMIIAKVPERDLEKIGIKKGTLLIAGRKIVNVKGENYIMCKIASNKQIAGWVKLSDLVVA